MATITSEVFRFVNLRAPALLQNQATPTANVKPIGAYKEKPTLLTQEDWDNTLLQKLRVAKEAPENENNQRQAMIAVMAGQENLSDIVNLQPYSFPPSAKLVDFYEYIETNAESLDKSTLRVKMVEGLNAIEAEDSESTITTTVANFSERIQSADAVKTELVLWDVITISSLYIKRRDLTEAAINALRILHLAKQVADFDNCPSESVALYAIFKAPIQLPAEIYPLPSAVKPTETAPTTDPLDAELDTAQASLAKWKAAETTLHFVKDQLREKQQQLTAAFVVTYNENGFPANLAESPKVEQEYLTAAALTENTQRCATPIAEVLNKGKDLLIEQYLCTETSRYSFDYMEREIKETMQKLQKTVLALTPAKQRKTVAIGGSVFSFEERVRGL